MNAQEALEILSKPWCNLQDLQKLAQLGETKLLNLEMILKRIWKIKDIYYLNTSCLW